MKLITSNPANDPKHPLDDLAAQAGQAAHDNTRTAADQAADAEQAQTMAAIEAGAAKVVLGLLKAARSFLAKRLPEILDEWPDDVLRQPAEAAIPLLRKHMESLMKIAGANPELAVFLMSLLPLVMGYVSAVEAHDRAAKMQAAAPPDAPQA